MLLRVSFSLSDQLCPCGRERWQLAATIAHVSWLCLQRGSESLSEEKSQGDLAWVTCPSWEQSPGLGDRGTVIGPTWPRGSTWVDQLWLKEESERGRPPSFHLKGSWNRISCAGQTGKDYYREDSWVTGFSDWLNDDGKNKTGILGETGQKLNCRFSKAYRLFKRKIEI